MVKAENEYYFRFILLLIRGGTKLLRTIVKNGLGKKNISLDEFLTSHREAIFKSKQITKPQREILFPVSPKVTEIEKWDITLLSFIASEYLTSALSFAEKQAVSKIRDMRNKYQAHTCNAALDDKQYTLIWTELTLVISTVCHSLSEDETLEFNGIITSIAVIDFDAAVAEIKQLDRSNEYLSSIQKSIEDIQQSQEQMKENVERCHQDVIAVKNAISVLKMEMDSKGRSTNILNEVSGEMNVNAEEKHTVDTATSKLLGALKEVTEQTVKSVLKEYLQKFLDDISKCRATIDSVKKGSVVFKFTCPSIDSLIDLIEYFNGDLIHERLQDISKALGDEIGSRVELDANIQLETLDVVMKKLGLLNAEEPDLDQRLIKKRKIRGKMFNDPIHGQIELHPLCVKIVDTPQFQRLRYIKQLEACYLVYPGASHNRFEHSIGVCYLAGKLLRAIQERQPEEDITAKDILCVEIAALCHDLGQGPFSHVFKDQFIRSIDPESEWRHEHASVKMFEYILSDNNGRIRRYFEQLMPAFEERDIVFIKELIDVPADLDSIKCPYKGRDKDRSFLYEVVANKKSGVDVDKWDYLARDSHMLGMKSNFDHTRCLYGARVLTSNGRKQICHRAAQDLYDMFYTRMTLHRRAYQHKTKNIIGIMICDALKAANEELYFIGENGKRLRMSDTIHDMVAYTKLTDDVFQTILRSSDVRLKTSRDILKNILNRDLYACIAQTQIKGGWIEKMAFRENLFNKIRQRQEDMTQLAEDFVEIDVSFVLPDTFSEQYVRVYCKVMDDQLIDVIEQAFKEWCSERKKTSTTTGFRSSKKYYVVGRCSCKEETDILQQSLPN